jgi:hypothetical protein
MERRAEAVARLAAPPTLELAPLSRGEWLADGDDDGKGPGAEPDDLPREVRGLVRRARGDLAGLDAAVGSGDLADSDPTALAYAREILTSPVYQAACADSTCRRDVPMLAMVDGALVDVVVDLVYGAPRRPVLVYFDVDGCSDGRVQAQLLARAFTAATGQPPTAVELIHAASGKVSRFEDRTDFEGGIGAGTVPT